MHGYYKNPEKTAEAMKGEWLLSGDVGVVFPNGAIKIIDRVKNIFKLSQGEYIAPEKVEGIFIKSLWCDQVWIYGDSFHDYPVGVLVANEARVKKWCQDNNQTFSKEILENLELKQTVIEDLWRMATESKLTSLEKPGQITLVFEPFSIENEIMTPTMKMKRNVAKKYYQARLDEMYSKPRLLPPKK